MITPDPFAGFSWRSGDHEWRRSASQDWELHTLLHDDGIRVRIANEFETPKFDAIAQLTIERDQARAAGGIVPLDTEAIARVAKRLESAGPSVGIDLMKVVREIERELGVQPPADSLLSEATETTRRSRRP